ncbi:polyphosphate kinase 1 [soil metagenome]
MAKSKRSAEVRDQQQSKDGFPPLANNEPQASLTNRSNGVDPAATPNLPVLEPGMFINRELSWLEFNRRVLAEAEDPLVPLLERIKFVSIFSSNLDEFFMIRAAGVKRKLTAGITEPGPDGRNATEQYALIRESAQALTNEKYSLFNKALVPRLKRRGISLTTVEKLKPEQQEALAAYFRRDVFPVLTPQAIDRARRFPHISNESLNLVVILRSRGINRYARVKIPAVLPRLVRVDGKGDEEPSDREVTFVWLEDLVCNHLNLLFPGHESAIAYPFHLTRDADIEIDEEDEDAHDLLAVMREMLSERTFGDVVRLCIDPKMPDSVRDWLLDQIGATHRELYMCAGPLALESLRELVRLERPELKDPPFLPATLALNSSSNEPGLDTSAWGTHDIFGLLRSRDVLAHHPYQSFSIVTDFLKAASTDPDVVAIKQTLYRIGRDSPLIPALIEARDDDTQVAVLVEVKARFDEENNISWAQQLEHHGVHVAYGVAGLKTHCKLTLVVRREADGLRRYAHLATGNYNATTARLYEDVGLFTSREDITHDVSELFNVLTGYSEQRDYRQLWVAPNVMRQHFIDAISREIESHRSSGTGRLIFKMNALVDRDLIRSLYAASQAGVQIDLIVRGACCLRPGVPGWSENIRVRSIVGRFLEHSRIFYFGNGGDDQLYMGSADLMERNLDRRVEVIFPVKDDSIKAHLRDTVLAAYLEDNVSAWSLGNDEIWTLVSAPAEAQRDIQKELMSVYASGDILGDRAGIGDDEVRTA